LGDVSGTVEDLMFLRSLGVCALVFVAACTVNGHGKAAKPAMKIYKTEHPYSFPPEPIQSGSIQVHVNKVFLEENKTVFSTQYWRARIYATVVSPKAVPHTAFDNSFTVIGKSGQVYPGHVSIRGGGRATWQHQEHTGQPTHLPPNVPGEIEVFADNGSGKTNDPLTAFTFKGVQYRLGP